MLARRDFALFIIGRCVTLLGNAMAPVAIAFAVLDLTGSPSSLGLVLAARTLPQVVLLIAGGVWADRLPRNIVWALSSVCAGAAQVVTAVLLISGAAQVWQLIVLQAANGAAAAFVGPADVGLVPLLVPGDRLQQANSLLRFGGNLALIGGAALAGLLVAAFNPGWTIAIDAATFFAAAVFVINIRGLSVAGADRPGFLSELVAGWREFCSHRWLWAIVVQFSVMLFAFVPGFNVLGPLVAKRSMDGAHSWGLIVAAEACGFLVGSLLMLRVRVPHPILVATWMCFVFALPLALLAAAAGAWTVASGAFVQGIAAQVFGVYWFTALHEHVEPASLSRVSAYDALGSLALAPLGMAVAGPVADIIGLSSTLWLAAAIVIGSTAAVLFVPEVRSLRSRPPAVEPALRG